MRKKDEAHLETLQRARARVLSAVDWLTRADDRKEYEWMAAELAVAAREIEDVCTDLPQLSSLRRLLRGSGGML